MKLYRLVLVLALAAPALQGCTNMVLSQTPLITAEDNDAAPKLKPGVWADEGCNPAAGLSGCEQVVFVTSQTMRIPRGAAGGVQDPDETRSYRLGGADPLVLQVDGSNDEGPAYAFAAIEPLRRDSQGRVDAVVAWQVLCGPPPEAAAAQPNLGQGVATDRPFPGVTMTDDGVCLAQDKPGLLAAARASRALKTSFRKAYHWVADQLPEAPKP